MSKMAIFFNVKAVLTPNAAWFIAIQTDTFYYYFIATASALLSVK